MLRPTSLSRTSFYSQVLALCFIVLFAGYIRSTFLSVRHTTNISLKTFVEGVEVTQTRTNTVWRDPDATQANSRIYHDRKLGQHKYLSNGLLEVNPNGPHPIFQLIERAEKLWDSKLKSASSTLEEAVVCYQRRYGRPPPLGFDLWWKYVQNHNVQLPDEYDQIHRDLEPFWGMDPRSLQRIQRDWEGHADSFTIGKEPGGRLRLLNYTLPSQSSSPNDMTEGGFMVMDLLKEVQDYIPPFRAVFSPHDTPNLLRDYELRRSALEAATLGTYIDSSQPIEPKPYHGWIAACHPKSPARREPPNWSLPPPLVPPPHAKSFIFDHREAMDPCQHPSIMRQHGQFLSHKEGPVPQRSLIPQFSYGPTLLHDDIVSAVPHGWVSDLSLEDDPEWDDKPDDRLQWRGRNTGIWMGDDSFWRGSQRIRMMDWANSALHANITILPSRNTKDEAVGGSVEVRKARYGPAMVDVAFSAEPLGCTPDVCRDLRSLFEFRQQHTWKQAGQYKYVLDVDGNGWSSRFKRLITSHSLVFKSTIYPEWFTDRIQPWVHYVPVQLDLSDLWDSLVFFQGDLNRENAHEEVAKRMALAGREWSLQFWRLEDMTAYMFRLFLEYARVMSSDRNSMSFRLPA